MRRFILLRDHDISGVSGTGLVAEGVAFSSDRAVLTWLGPPSSTTLHDSVATLIASHGHGGAVAGSATVNPLSAGRKALIARYMARYGPSTAAIVAALGRDAAPSRSTTARALDAHQLVVVGMTRPGNPLYAVAADRHARRPNPPAPSLCPSTTARVVGQFATRGHLHTRALRPH